MIPNVMSVNILTRYICLAQDYVRPPVPTELKMGTSIDIVRCHAEKEHLQEMTGSVILVMKKKI